MPSTEEFFDDVFQNGYFGYELNEQHPLWSAYQLWIKMKKEEEED